jgi:twinkle protein
MKVYLWFLGMTDAKILLSKLPQGWFPLRVDPEDPDATLNLIHERWEHIKDVEAHIFFPNDDDFNFDVKQEIVRRVGPEKSFIAKYPKGFTELEDIDDPDLIELVENSVPIPIDGIYKASDCEEGLVDLYNNGSKPGMTCGYPSLDRYYTVKPGQLTIVTGTPSHGKSEFIDAILVNLAQRHNQKFAVFSPENYPIKRHVIKLIRKYIGKPYGKPYNGTMSWDEAEQGREFIDAHFSFINSTDITFKVTKILDMAKICIIREGINGLLIDPWNEVDHARPSNLSETEYISQSLTEIRKFARHNNIHIWVIAHPSKRKKEDWKNPPLLYDISGSAHWFNKADNGITVYRDDVTNNESPTTIVITKVRFRENGRPGEIQLRYHLASGRYYA